MKPEEKAELKKKEKIRIQKCLNEWICPYCGSDLVDDDPQGKGHIISGSCLTCPPVTFRTVKTLLGGGHLVSAPRSFIIHI